MDKSNSLKVRNTANKAKQCSAILHFISCLSFLVGSILFLNVDTAKIAIWLFIGGSGCGLISSIYDYIVVNQATSEVLNLYS